MPLRPGQPIPDDFEPETDEDYAAVARAFVLDEACERSDREHDDYEPVAYET